jgi:hypothetical protein
VVAAQDVHHPGAMKAGALKVATVLLMAALPLGAFAIMDRREARVVADRVEAPTRIASSVEAPTTVVAEQHIHSIDRQGYREVWEGDPGVDGGIR